MKKVLVLILLITSFSCEKVEIDESDLVRGRIMVIGHAGSGLQRGNNPLPTNSMLSINKAIDVYNADGVEVDIQLSKDGEVMLHHSKLLDGKTTCQGFISDYTASELNNCYFREDFAVNTFLDEPIISLEKIMGKYSAYDSRPYIILDTKYYPENYKELTKNEYHLALAERITELYNTYNYSDRLIVEGSDVFYLEEIRKRNTEILLFIEGDFENILDKAIAHNFDGITLKSEKITKEQVDIAHDNGLLVSMHGVRNQKSTREAVEKAPDFIQTDNIRLLTRYLN